MIGRSILVGRPMASLLVNADATVTVCHSRTRDLAAVCRGADVLIAAVGRPEMVEGDWIKPGATVIDVGMNRTDDGLVGDVDFDSAAAVAGRITPVPGGVGPMTIAMLLANTVRASRGKPGSCADEAAPAISDGETIAAAAAGAAARDHVPDELVRDRSGPVTRSPTVAISARPTPGRRCPGSAGCCCSRSWSRFGAAVMKAAGRQCRYARRTPGHRHVVWRHQRASDSRPDRVPARVGGRSGGSWKSSITREFGVFLGLLAAAGIAYGGWRAMTNESRPRKQVGTGSAQAEP